MLKKETLWLEFTKLQSSLYSVTYSKGNAVYSVLSFLKVFDKSPFKFQSYGVLTKIFALSHL